METTPNHSPMLRALTVPLALTLAVALFTAWLQGRLPDVFMPDYLCYWTAGLLIAEGQDPYDADAQRQRQREYGYDEERHRGEVANFIAYYYPPWFGILCVPFTLLDYQSARVAWAGMNLELLALSGWLLRPAARRLPAWVPVVLVVWFHFSQYALWMGQTPILFLFALVVAWRLAEGGWDRSAGAVLTWLTFKPQLAAIVVFGFLLWALCQRRWSILVGFGLGVAGLLLVSFAVQPHWLSQIREAMREAPLPTDIDPGIGSVWLLVLRTLGLQGPLLAAGYLALAGPFFAAVILAARYRSLLEVVGVSCLAVFFIAPYSQAYDFPLLLIPMLIVLNGQQGESRPLLLFLALMVLPYLHFVLHSQLGRPHDKYLYFWVPMVLALLWLQVERRGKNPAVSG